MRVILLTGGQSSRFGSDKSLAELSGNSLSNIIKSYFEADQIIEVGSEIKGGPLAAVNSALTKIDSDLVAIIATDMPFAPKVLPELQIALNTSTSSDCALPLDNQGVAQPLAGIYKTKSLIAAMEKLQSESEVFGQSMRSLLKFLQVNIVKVKNPELLIDIDTKADLKIALDLWSQELICNGKDGVHNLFREAD